MSAAVLLEIRTRLARVLGDRGLNASADSIGRRVAMAAPHICKIVKAVEDLGLGDVQWTLEPVHSLYTGSYGVVLHVTGRDADGIVRCQGIDLATVRGVVDDATPDADAYATAKLAAMGGGV